MVSPWRRMRPPELGQKCNCGRVQYLHVPKDNTRTPEGAVVILQRSCLGSPGAVWIAPEPFACGELCPQRMAVGFRQKCVSLHYPLIPVTSSSRVTPGPHSGKRHPDDPENLQRTRCLRHGRPPRPRCRPAFIAYATSEVRIFLHDDVETCSRHQLLPLLAARTARTTR